MTHASLLDLFAGELRRLRTKAGLTQEGLATRINYSTSLVGLVEQCRRMPRLEFTEQCDAVLEAEGLLLRIRDVISQAALLPWFREWVAIEQEALSLRSYESLVVPGLLQTEDYVRALHEGASPLAGEAMEQQVLARMNRQAVLNRADPPDMLVVLDHGILSRPVGGPKVMREQLLHLVAMGRRPRVHIHVVPETVGAYRGLNGPFVIATPNEGRDIAYIDNQLFGTVVERPVDVRSLQQTWDAVRAEALSHHRRPVPQPDHGGGRAMELTGGVWRKSTRSSGNSGNCVEVADNLTGVVGVRDSKDPSGPVLVFAPAAWRSFVDFAKQR